MKDYEAQAEALVTYIAPIKFIGRRDLVVAVWKMTELFNEKKPDNIKFTKEVYPAAAKELGKTVDAAQRAINRSAAFCWKKGRNARLNEIIGTVLPEKPNPSQILLYCAYYITYRIPYHKAAHEPSLPLLF